VPVQTITSITHGEQKVKRSLLTSTWNFVLPLTQKFGTTPQAFHTRYTNPTTFYHTCPPNPVLLEYTAGALCCVLNLKGLNDLEKFLYNKKSTDLSALQMEAPQS
jgi:hypothetical protein